MKRSKRFTTNASEFCSSDGVNQILLDHVGGIIMSLNYYQNEYQIYNPKRLNEKSIPPKGRLDYELYEIIRQRVHSLDQELLYDYLSYDFIAKEKRNKIEIRHNTFRYYNNISNRYETYSLTIHLPPNKKSDTNISIIYIDKQKVVDPNVETTKKMIQSIHNTKEICDYHLFVINITKDYIERLDRSLMDMTRVHIRENFSEEFERYVRNYIHRDDQAEYISKFNYKQLSQVYHDNVSEIVNQERHMKKDGTYDWYLTVVTVLPERIEGDVFCVVAIKNISSIISRYTETYEFKHKIEKEKRKSRLQLSVICKAKYSEAKFLKCKQGVIGTYFDCIYQYEYSTNTYRVICYDGLETLGKRTYQKWEEVYQKFFHILHEQDVSYVKSAIEKMTSSEYNQKEAWLKYRKYVDSKTYHWMCMTAILVDEDKNEKKSLMVYVKDINAMIISSYDNHQMNVILQKMLEIFEVLLVKIDPKNQIYYNISKNFCSRFGYEGNYSELVEELSQNLLSDDYEWFLETMELENICECAKKGIVQFAYQYIYQSTEIRWIMISSAYCRGKQGNEELYLIVRDITNIKREETTYVKEQMLCQQRYFDEMISTSGDRLRAVIEQTEVIIFDWNIVKNSFYISPNWTHTFGFVFQEKNILTFLKNPCYVCQEDLRLVEQFEKNIGKCQEDILVCRLKDATNEYVKYKISTHCKLNDESKAIKIVGTIQKYGIDET